MLLKMTDEPDDYEGPWPREDAMTKPTVDDVMGMIHEYTFANTTEADTLRNQIRAAVESLIAAPVQQAEPVGYFLRPEDDDIWAEVADEYKNDEDVVPLYLHPPPDEVQRLPEIAIAEAFRCGEESAIQSMRNATPVATVCVHRTGGNAGIAWSGVPVDDCIGPPDGTPLYLRPDPEVQRLRDALQSLIEVADQSADSQYGTPFARSVRDIARRALEGGE